MIKAAHLTDEQVAGFVLRSLDAAELVVVDRHLEVCGECRERLERQMSAPGLLQELRAQLSEHLEYEQVAAASGGRKDPGVQEHLAECAMCRAEVEDLRSFRSELKPASAKVVQMPVRRAKSRIPGYVAVAAGLVLTISIAVRLLRQEPRATQ